MCRPFRKGSAQAGNRPAAHCGQNGYSVLHAQATLARPLSAALIAQLVEHLICNQGVSGSNPDGGTNFFNGLGVFLALCRQCFSDWVAQITLLLPASLTERP